MYRALTGQTVIVIVIVIVWILRWSSMRKVANHFPALSAKLTVLTQNSSFQRAQG